jgi:type II secretory pathway component PulM
MVRRKVTLTIVVFASIAIAASGIVDDAAADQAEDAFKRALVTFAVARTLNGVISLAQGTELALEPGGVGVNLGVGEILDPVNDLVEQFSGVMLVAASSLGLQNVLLRITAWWGCTALLIGAGLVALVLAWWPGPVERRLATFGTRLLMVVLVLRFIVPALVIGTNVVAKQFLEDEQRAATAALEAASEEIEEISEETAPPSAADRSMLERFGDSMRDTLKSMDFDGRLERLKLSLANASEHIVNLIVLFVLQTILLPIAFVWLILELLKGAISRTAILHRTP